MYSIACCSSQPNFSSELLVVDLGIDPFNFSIMRLVNQCAQCTSSNRVIILISTCTLYSYFTSSLGSMKANADVFTFFFTNGFFIQ